MLKIIKVLEGIGIFIILGCPIVWAILLIPGSIGDSSDLRGLLYISTASLIVWIGLGIIFTN